MAKSSLDRCRPGGLLDRLGIIGHPWHGLVKNGRLQLPNGEAKAYPQPGGGIWQATASHLLYVPGVPPVERTSGQMAEDIAAGRQWRNTATLSGVSNLLYGKALGGGCWVWVDPQGDRWLIDARALHDQYWTADTIPDQVTIRRTRFGLFAHGVGKEEYEYVVTIPNRLGQTDDVPLWWNTENHTFALTANLYSIHPTGAAAAFMIQYSTSSFGDFPCGWYEVRINDDGAPSVDIIADRLTTLGGTGEPSESGSVEVDEDQKVVIAFRATYKTIGTTEERTAEVTMLPYARGGDYGGWTVVGQFDYDHVETLLFSPAVQATRISRFVGAVYAVWYSPDGERQLLTLDVEQTVSAEGSGPPAFSFSRTDTRTPPEQFPAFSTGLSHTVTTGWRSQVRCTWSVSGGEAHTYTYTRATTDRRSITFGVGFSNSKSTDGETEVGGSFTTGLPPSSLSSSWSVDVDTNPRGIVYLPGFVFSSLRPWLSYGYIDFPGGDEISSREVQFCRFGHSVFGFVASDKVRGTSSPHLYLFDGIVITPSGTASAMLPADVTVWPINGYAYAAYDSLTGQVVMDRRPVCFV